MVTGNSLKFVFKIVNENIQGAIPLISNHFSTELYPKTDKDFKDDSQKDLSVFIGKER